MLTFRTRSAPSSTTRRTGFFAPDFSWIPAEDKSGEPSHAPESSIQVDDPPVLPYAHHLDVLLGDIGSLRIEVQQLHQSHSDFVAAMQRSVDVITSQHQDFSGHLW